MGGAFALMIMMALGALRPSTPRFTAAIRASKRAATSSPRPGTPAILPINRMLARISGTLVTMWPSAAERRAPAFELRAGRVPAG